MVINNGFKAQWGITGSLGGGGSTEVTYPVAYYSHHKTVGSTNRNSNDWSTACIPSISLTKFKALHVTNIGGNAQILWLSFGF